MQESNPISEGVQELIDRLHEEGVKPGREAGQKILSEAKREAARILDEARDEARRIRSEAHRHVEAEKKAAGEALRVAVRDTVLDLREQLQLTFEHHIGKLIGAELREEEVLERMLLIIVEQAVNADGMDDLRLLIGTDGLGEEATDRFVAKVTKTMLEKGIEIAPYRGSGIRIALEEGALTIDLSETVLAAMIHRMIVPRFQAIFEGIGN